MKKVHSVLSVVTNVLKYASIIIVVVKGLQQIVEDIKTEIGKNNPEYEAKIVEKDGSDVSE